MDGNGLIQTYINYSEELKMGDEWRSEYPSERVEFRIGAGGSDLAGRYESLEICRG